MLTIRLGRTMYKINPENEARIMDGYAKAAKIKRKPVISGVKRKFPKYGAEQSTHAYVREYFELNSPGVFSPGVDGYYQKGMYSPEAILAAAIEAAEKALGMFEPLSKHISAPVGVDSLEIEA